MFVNYCGSDRKRVESSIKEAVQECRSRQGHLFKTGFYVDATVAPNIEELAEIISIE
jgi:hypothetical protein